MMFWRSPSNAAPAASQLSSVSVRTIVEAPARMSVSLSLVTVPVSATEALAVMMSNVGAAASATTDWTNADAGTVAVIVSVAVMS